MAQVIRKYQPGGPIIDPKPINILGNYYDPKEYLEQMNQYTEEYAQNKGYTGEFLKLFRDQSHRVNRAIVNGTGHLNPDGTFTGTNTGVALSKGPNFSKEYDVKKGTGSQEDAAGAAISAVFNNLGRVSQYSKPKYDLDVHKLVERDFGDRWWNLDTPDETTGLSNTNNRVAALRKSILSEMENIRKNPQNYSYSSNDYDTWSLRTRPTLEYWQSILDALDDGKIETSERSSLPAGFDISDLMDTGKSSELYKTKQAQAEAKAKQESQQRDAQRKANNKYVNSFLYGIEGIEAPYFDWDGTRYNYADFKALNTEEANAYLTALQKQYLETFKNTNVGLNFPYAADISKFFFNNELDKQGLQIIKGYSTDPFDINGQQFYMYNVANSTYKPIVIKKNDNNKYIAYDPDENLALADLGYLNQTQDSITNFQPLTAAVILAQDPNAKVTRLKKDQFQISNGYLTITVVNNSDLGDSPSAKDLLTHQGTTEVQKGQYGMSISRIDPYNTLEIYSKPDTTSTFTTGTLPAASLSKEENVKESERTGLKITDSDKARLGAAMTDVASMALGFTPGTNIASAAVGAGSSLTEFVADISDLISGREGRQGFWSSLGELGVNLGLDAISLIPGAKSPKVVKTLGSLSRFVPYIMTAIQAGNILLNENERKSVMSTINKIDNLQLSSLNTNDYYNIAFLGRALLLGKHTYKNVKSGKASSSEVDLDSDNLTAKYKLTNGTEIEVSTDIDRSKYKGIGNTKKAQNKALTEALQKSVDAQVRPDIEQRLRSENANAEVKLSEVDLKGKIDTEVSNKVNELIGKDTDFTDLVVKRKKSTLTSSTEESEYRPKGIFESKLLGWKGYRGWGSDYYHQTKRSRSVSSTNDNKQNVDKPQSTESNQPKNTWNISTVRNLLNRYGGFTPELKGKSDKELLKLFPNRESLNAHLKTVHTPAKKNSTLQLSNEDLADILQSLPENLRRNPNTITKIEEAFARFSTNSEDPIKKTKLWAQKSLVSSEAKLRDAMEIAKMRLDNDIKNGDINNPNIGDPDVYNAYLESQYLPSVSDTDITIYRLNSRKTRQLSEQAAAESQRVKRSDNKISRRNAKRLKTGADYDMIEEFIQTAGKKTKEKATANPKIRRAILKMLREGKSAAQIRYEVSKMLNGGTLIPMYQGSGSIDRRLFPALTFETNNPPLKTIYEQFPFYLRTSPFSTTSLNINVPEFKVEPKFRATSQDAFTITSDPKEEEIKTKWEFTPDKATLLDLTSLGTNIAGNIAQAKELIENFKTPKVVQSPNLGHHLVTGDYISKQLRLQQAGTLNTLASDVAGATSDGNVGARLSGYIQGMNALQQGNAADSAAKLRNMGIAEERRTQQNIQDTQAANQNASAAVAANNYKSQIKAQTTGTIFQNVNKFLDEMRIAERTNKARMQELDLQMQVSDLQKEYEQEMTNWKRQNYLAKAEAYLKNKGIDTSVMSERDKLDKFYESNTKAYEAVQSQSEAFGEDFRKEYLGLQYDIYAMQPWLKKYQQKPNLTTGKVTWEPVHKKGGSIKDKIRLQKLKDYNKSKLETRKENAKSLRENSREFSKNYRSLSAATLALLKKAME